MIVIDTHKAQVWWFLTYSLYEKKAIACPFTYQFLSIKSNQINSLVCFLSLLTHCKLLIDNDQITFHWWFMKLFIFIRKKKCTVWRRWNIQYNQQSNTKNLKCNNKLEVIIQTADEKKHFSLDKKHFIKSEVVVFFPCIPTNMLRRKRRQLILIY
jgi:hypothetical protein